jgi:hypothetical protein
MASVTLSVQSYLDKVLPGGQLVQKAVSQQAGHSSLILMR